MIGYVGAGKTTQSACLITYFAHRGINIKYTNIKYFHFISEIICSFIKKFIGINDPLYLKINKILVTIDLIFNTFLILPFLNFIRIKLPAYLGKIIIVEEHILGSIVDYIHACWTYKINWNLVKVLTKFLWKLVDINESIIILFTANYSVLINHWLNRGSHLEKPSYLLSQYIVFNIYKKFLPNIIIIDTSNKSIKETYIELREMLLNRLK